MIYYRWLSYHRIANLAEKSPCHASENLCGNNSLCFWAPGVANFSCGCQPGFTPENRTDSLPNCIREFLVVLVPVLAKWLACIYCTAVVLKLWYSCHLWHFDQKIVALCLYFYLTLLTQRCKGNDTQADKSQNHCTYIVQNVHCTCTLLFVHVMILTCFIKLFAYLEYYCDCENLFWKYHKIYK